jgi:transglutaminase-like putative cysteine protease
MEHAMRHFNKVLTTLFLAGFLLFLPFTLIAQAAKHARSFEFTYEAVLKNIPSTAHTVRIWIPIASPNPHQAVKIIQKVVPVPARITRDPVFGNRMLYAVMKHPHSSTARFRIVYAVTRYEYSRGDYRNLMAYNRDPAQVPVSLVRFVQPDRLVPTGGVIAQIASETTRGKEGQIEKAFALYNYVFHNMRYDKSGTGWGRGDALWACDAKHGNCTDFHSLFMALARAENIPTRFDIGFPLPQAAQGTIPGYHCWAEFYVQGLGWAPVDISEAWQNPSKHDFFFGSLDANRVLFSTGRDLTLAPKQDGPPVNYFVYPYIEVDGKVFDSVERRFSFQNLTVVERH